MKNFPGMYRGVVVYNEDDNVKGRVKIYIPGIYKKEYIEDPMKLPWAEPAMSIFGGSGNWGDMSLNKETGVCSVPHANKDDINLSAQLWVFFEEDDPQKPIYWAVCQSGDGWFSEHPNQHRIQTNNVLIQIDDEPSNEKSTAKTDYSNDTAETYGNDGGKKKQVKTTVTISILNPGNCALNLKIVGDVNLDIDGDCVEHITGDKYVTIDGNEYRTTRGDTYITQDGDETLVRNGSLLHTTVGKSIYLNTDLVSITSAKQVIIGAPIITWLYMIWGLYTQTLTEDFHLREHTRFTGDVGETLVSVGDVNRAYLDNENKFVKTTVSQLSKDNNTLSTRRNIRYGGDLISDVTQKTHMTVAKNVSRSGTYSIGDSSNTIAQVAASVNSNISPTIMDVGTLIAHI